MTEQNKQDRINDTIITLENFLKQNQQSIDTLKNQQDTYTVLINNIKSEQELLREVVTSQKTQLDIYEIVKFVLSEEGVKAYIVEKALDILNSLINNYLKRLDLPCVLKFNQFFEEEIFNERGKACSYYNFSGAERKSIDLACMFAFMDMRRLQGNTTYNICFFDELFDSCLDSRGIQIVAKILQERAIKNNEGIYVISHRSENLSDVINQTIIIEKQNGISKRLDLM